MGIAPDPDDYIDLARCLTAQAWKRLSGVSTLIEFDDLLGYATVGLCEACASYDEERGVQFETFAGARIRGAILDGLREWDHLRRVDRRRVKAGLQEAPSFTSLDAPIRDRHEDTWTTLADQLAGDPSDHPDQQAAQRERAATVAHAVERLPETLADLVDLHYFHEYSLAEIARTHRDVRTPTGAALLHRQAARELRRILRERESETIAEEGERRVA